MLEVGKRYTFIKEKAMPELAEITITRFVARVNWIEDRGDFWYIGYTPDDFRVCRFGALKVKKDGKFKSVNYRFEEVES